MKRSFHSDLWNLQICLSLLCSGKAMNTYREPSICHLKEYPELCVQGRRHTSETCVHLMEGFATFPLELLGQEAKCLHFPGSRWMMQGQWVTSGWPRTLLLLRLQAPCRTEAFLLYLATDRTKSPPTLEGVLRREEVY
jgi:hypothetical protein